MPPDAGLPGAGPPSDALNGMPRLGQGTWRMGEGAAPRAQEADALRLGLDLGMTLVDTAEMYGDGAAEEVVADAIAGRRDQVFLVSKVYPHNASRTGVPAACERSLRRLRTDRLDLYLLHWRGQVPLAETVAAFEALQAAGKIRRWGVSNFDVGDMQGLPVMAYSPVGQGGRLLRHTALAAVAARHGVTPAQVALAWTLRQPGVVSIPKAGDAKHVRENAAAGALLLTAEDLAALDAAFPPPRRKHPLEML